MLNKDVIPKQELLKQDQSLSNSLRSGDVGKALNLALKLGRPQVTLRILRSEFESGRLDEALERVKPHNLTRLGEYVRNWNTKTGGGGVELVQLVQKFLLLKAVLSEDHGSLDGLEGLRAFDEKHLARVDRLRSRMVILDALLEGR